MIISHSKQFCYWKIPRTGSNTAELCIRMSGVLDLSQDIVMSCHFFPGEHNVPKTNPYVTGHLLPSSAITFGMLTQEQYDRYTHYTIVRNPIDRWISAYSFKCRKHIMQKISPSEYYENGREELVCRRQSDYLALGGVRTFPFSDFENSITTIVRLIGGRLDDVPKLEHLSRKRVLFWAREAVEKKDPELKDKILAWYADDLQLEY